MPEDGEILFEGKPIRVERKTIMDGRYHVLTSPDVTGLFIAATTEEAATRDAIAVLRLIEDHKARRASEMAQEEA